MTGGSSGIGKETAALFAHQGYNVAIAARRMQLLQEAQKDLEQTGSKSLAIAADVSIAAEVQRMVESVLTQWGQIDVLIHAAGILTTGTLLETTEDDFDQVININLKGTALVNRYVLQHMVERRQGSIVNIASDAGIVGCPRLTAYCASKGGVVLLTKAMALDYAGQNIRINALCPGPVETPMTLSGLTAEEKATWQQLLPMQRFTKATEVAEAAYFLAHAESATGTCFVLDGGNTAGGRT